MCIVCKICAMPRIVIWSWELGPDVSPVQARLAYREIVKRDPCAYCGGPAEVVDHIVPRASNFGDDAWDNMTGACAVCNAGKRSESLLGALLGVGVGPARGRGQYYPGESERAKARRAAAVVIEALAA